MKSCADVILKKSYMEKKKKEILHGLYGKGFLVKISHIITYR